MAILPTARREGGRERGGGRARARERSSARGRKTRREKQAGHVYEKKSDRFNAVAAVRCLLIVEFKQFHFLIVLFLGTFVEGFGDLLLKVYHCCCCCCWGRFCQVFDSCLFSSTERAEVSVMLEVSNWDSWNLMLEPASRYTYAFPLLLEN